MNALAVRMLAWELWSHKRLELTAILIGIPGVMIVANVVVSHIPDLVILQAITRLLGAWSVVYLALLFSYADFSRQRLETGFPRHVLLLPLPTWALAVVPLLCASLVMLAFALVIIHIAGVWDLAPIDHLWLALAALAMTAWLQAINWGLNKSPFRAALALFAILGLGGAAIVSVVSFSPAHLLPAPWGSATLVALATLGAVLGYAAVRGERRGSTIGKVRFWSDWSIPGFRFKRHLHGPASAQFWYEWRVFGWIFPLATLFFATVLWAAMTFPSDRADSSEAGSMVALMFIYIAALLGVELGKSHVGAADHQMTGFWASRPLSTAELAHAKLRVAAFSIALGTLICLVPIAVHLASNQQSALVATWNASHGRHGWLGASLLGGLAVSMIPLTAWTLCANLLAFGLAGSPHTKRRMILSLVLGIPVLVLIGYQLRHNPAWLITLSNNAALFAAVPLVLIAALSAAAVARYLRRQPARLLVAPAIVMSGWFAAAVIGLRSVGLTGSSLTVTVLLLGALAIAAMIPWILAPLMLQRNRHR